MSREQRHTLPVVGRATLETMLAFPEWPWGGKRVVVLTHRPLGARHGEELHAGALAPLAARLTAEASAASTSTAASPSGRRSTRAWSTR